MFNFNKPFPFFLNNDRENFLLIAGISAFIYIFIKVFRPFGALSTTQDEAHVYSIITLLVLSFNILLLPRLFPRFLDDGNWTLRSYLLFNVYNMLSITFFITLSHYITREPELIHPFLFGYFNDLWRTAAIGILPLVALTFILENRSLSNMLSSGDAATDQLKRIPLVDERSANVITVSSERSGAFELDLSKFLFAQAENNYCKLWKTDDGKVGSELVRIFIKDLCDQVASEAVVRCHRSYVVNLRHVSRVSGNANGYRLHFKNTLETIPVSRAMGKDVLEGIALLSEQM